MKNGVVAMLIGEIATLTYLVNTHTQFCAFVEFSGHVNQLLLSIRKDKENFDVKLIKQSAYLDSEKSLTILKSMRSELRKILRHNNINYSRLPYEIEEVRHYKFGQEAKFE